MTYYQIVNESSDNHFLRFDVKSILTNTYEYWPEIRTVLNMAKMASSVRAHWFEYTGKTDPIDCSMRENYREIS
jgi:hypothetical protein